MPDITRPLVTIAIPTYNRADRFLKQALQCAVQQTYTPIEIIVSDNCSTDHTQSLVSSFDDHRIRYIRHEKNIGAHNNFNFCVHAANGHFFVLLHDDDLIDPDFVETCIDSMDGNYNVGVVFAGNRVIDSQNNILHETPNVCAGLQLTQKEFFTYWFKGKIAFYLCSTIFNTERLKSINGFYSKRNLFDDVATEAILSWKYGRTDVYDVKSSFRRHSDNSGGKPETVLAWCDDCLFLLDLLMKLSGNDSSFRKVGIEYFASKNYKLAQSIDSLPKKISTYQMINRMYNYSYSPQRFFYNLKIKPWENRFRHLLKKILSHFLFSKNFFLRR